MKNLVIVGAGPGLGLSLAKEFGKADYRIGLIARRQEKLNEYVHELSELNITATSAEADVTNHKQLGQAFSNIKKEHGPADVMIYNAAVIEPSSAIETTAEKLLSNFKVDVAGGIAAVQNVLPHMIERESGALLFTGGGHKELTVTPALTTLSIGKSALRSYAHCLHQELKEKGIYAGIFTISGIIKEGTYFSPEKIARSYYNMVEEREKVEVFYSDGTGDEAVNETYKSETDS